KRVGEGHGLGSCGNVDAAQELANLAGVLKSLQQGLTGDKIPFVRTPKVKNRTAAPAIYVLIPYAIVAFSALTIWRDFQFLADHVLVPAVQA
ncbi:hypothetical protein ACKLTP_18950, partial [Paenarthrobacter ureafaciens]|uniref:hypothetical protein n=1 Tax=Paenarthrobacter ureafaciens TaxID=37931 RepID=UPI00397834B2